MNTSVNMVNNVQLDLQDDAEKLKANFNEDNSDTNIMPEKISTQKFTNGWSGVEKVIKSKEKESDLDACTNGHQTDSRLKGPNFNGHVSFLPEVKDNSDIGKADSNYNDSTDLNGTLKLFADCGSEITSVEDAKENFHEESARLSDNESEHEINSNSDRLAPREDGEVSTELENTSADTKIEVDENLKIQEATAITITSGTESTSVNSEENVNFEKTVEESNVDTDNSQIEVDVPPEKDGSEKTEVIQADAAADTRTDLNGKYDTEASASNSDSDEKTNAKAGFRFLGIDWAPLNIPLERRMQTFAAFFWFFCVSFGFFLNFIALGLILCSFLWPLGIFYIYWIYYDRETALKGGRTITLFRRFKLWHYFRDYFPIRLIKTADLPPTKNYLFCVYPHGFLATGAVLNFATDANEFYKLYPGLKSHLLTLSFNFNLPFSRETILGLGGCSVAEKSILNLLGGAPNGEVGVLLVGGAAESAKAEPGTYRIVIKNRKGFVRVALKSGKWTIVRTFVSFPPRAPPSILYRRYFGVSDFKYPTFPPPSPIAALVPVFSFGENDLYGQYKNKSIEGFQNFIHKCFGFVPLIPRGRGFFQYSFGIIPYSRPINTVVGKCIDVPKILKPTKEDIDLYHKKYINALLDLFNEYKTEYDPKGASAELIME